MRNVEIYAYSSPEASTRKVVNFGVRRIGALSMNGGRRIPMRAHAGRKSIRGRKIQRYMVKNFLIEAAHSPELGPRNLNFPERKNLGRSVSYIV